MKERKFVYIVQTGDVPKFEEVAGKIEDALNWEATNLGLHVEVELSPEECSLIESLPSVSVFNEVQHVLTDGDREVHRQMLWSKQAADEHKSHTLPSGEEIFIVHGRDEEAAQAVARFLDKLGLNPVILHEKPSQGRTIIEKFEHHAKVGFAVVLLTPDDVGAFQGNETNLKPRARQNVVLELGYFLGRLGRNRVCALKKGDVEIPSDYAGVMYIPLDNPGGWKIELVKELKSAGLNFDETGVFEDGTRQ